MSWKRVVVITGEGGPWKGYIIKTGIHIHGELIRTELRGRQEWVLVEFNSQAWRTNSNGKIYYPELWYKRQHVKFKTIWVYPKWYHNIKNKIMRWNQNRFWYNRIQRLKSKYQRKNKGL